jgi:hypothetical protein
MLLAVHGRFIGCLPFEKSIIDSLIMNDQTHFTTYSGIIVAYNYRKRLQLCHNGKLFFKVNTVALKLTFL